MPEYHRILKVPVEEIVHGDVVIVYDNLQYNWRSFFPAAQLTNVRREEVLNHHRDPADGTIYIETNSCSGYVAASDFIRLDCLMTFGRNVKPA